MTFTNENQVSVIVPAIDLNAYVLGTSSSPISFKNYNHATVILSLGVTNTSSAVTPVWKKATTAAGCATGTAFACKYRYCLGAGDTFSALATYGASGVAFGSGGTIDYDTGGGVIIWEIDASDLGPTDAYPYCWAQLTGTVSSHSALGCIVAIMSEPRYSAAIMPTALA